MKRIIFLFATLFAINVFACEGAFHETLQEVQVLHREGYKAEAHNLMHELAHTGVLNHGHVKCFKHTAEVLSWGPSYYTCTKCKRTYENEEPDECEDCGNTEFDFTPRGL